MEGLLLDTYNGLAKDDPCKIKGVRGDFKFRSARTDAQGNVLYVTVIGGPANHSMFRHFTPERVTKKKGKR